MDALKEINNQIFGSLADALFQRIPEFKEYYQAENKVIDFSDGVYLFMNEFASFLFEELQKNQASTIVKKSFVFINEIGMSHNLEVLNIVRVGILEVLYSSEGIDRELVSELLSPRLKEYFQEFSKYYY